MKIVERLKSDLDCSDADLTAILALLESEKIGNERNDEATGKFTMLDATQLDLNNKRRNIVKNAVQAASYQGMAAAVNWTKNDLL